MGILRDTRQMNAGAIVRVILFLAFSMKSYAKNNSFTATFTFGDSLLEVGNNNYIVTLSKANYVPNGIDFGEPTGRFTNGRTIVDIIGQELGMEDFPPPYLAPTAVGPVILKGLNYASGAGGILNETGKLFGGRINMDAQLDYFANTKQDIIASIGAPATEELLNNALFAVAMGSNDFINNYLLPEHKPPADVFVDSMISRYRLQLTRLYNMGARNIVVTNVGPIGCIPYLRDVNTPTADDSCVAFPNELAQSFNSQLKPLLTELTSNLAGSKFLYGDAYRTVADIIQNYMSYGFEISNSACCFIAGIHGGLIPCIPASKFCEDRTKYVFWDPYHPSDASNVIIAKRLLYGDIDDISPMNVMQLLKSS